MLSTELKEMEQNKLVSPWQADSKRYVYDLLLLSFIWLAKGVSVQVELARIQSF